MESDHLRTHPKQKRSTNRVNAILDAASSVFAEYGYDDAPITVIAARANTAVGSLYQFFANKEAILRALFVRYVDRATVVFANVNIEAFPTLTLEESVRQMLIPLKEFLRDNHDFQVIFSSSIGSSFLAEAIKVMDDALLARTDAAIRAWMPQFTERERRKYELVCMVTMKALLSLAPPADGLTLDEVFEELEVLYVRYLTPIMAKGMKSLDHPIEDV